MLDDDLDDKYHFVFRCKICGKVEKSNYPNIRCPNGCEHQKKLLKQREEPKMCLTGTPIEPYRITEIKEVFKDLFEHVLHYTIPQYGDYPDDRLTIMRFQDCIMEIEKYTTRNKRKVVGGKKRQKMDMLKIIHYAIAGYKKI